MTTNTHADTITATEALATAATYCRRANLAAHQASHTNLAPHWEQAAAYIKAAGLSLAIALTIAQMRAARCRQDQDNTAQLHQQPLPGSAPLGGPGPAAPTDHDAGHPSAEAA